MTVFNKSQSAASRVLAMSRALSCDLEHAMIADPKAQAHALRVATKKCAKCNQAGACTEMLQPNAQLVSAPPTCPNAAWFASLSPDAA